MLPGIHGQQSTSYSSYERSILERGFIDLTNISNGLLVLLK